MVPLWLLFRERAPEKGAGYLWVPPLCQPICRGRNYPHFTDEEKEEQEQQACWTLEFMFSSLFCGQFKLNCNPILGFVQILDFLVLLSESRLWFCCCIVLCKKKKKCFSSAHFHAAFPFHPTSVLLMLA